MSEHHRNGAAAAAPTADPPAAAPVTDHPFEPRGAWYSPCRHCRLAEAAHRTTTLAQEDRR